MQTEVAQKINTALERSTILSVAALFKGYIHDNALAVHIWKWSHSQFEFQLLLNLVLEDNNRKIIIQTTSRQISNLLKQKSHLKMKDCNISAIFHKKHSIDQVLQKIKSNIPHKSTNYHAKQKIVASRQLSQKSFNKEVKGKSQESKIKKTSSSLSENGAFVKKNSKQELPKKSRQAQKKIEMPTNYSQVREQLDKKLSQQNKEEEKRKNKMTIQSDEDYYDKHKFQQAMKPESEKAKQTDSSGKKSNDNKNIDVPQKKLNFVEGSEDEDQEDIFAQMNQANKSKPQVKAKQEPPPQIKKTSSKSNISTGTKGNSLLGWLSKK